MPLIIPKELPAYGELSRENVFVMHQQRAQTQQIRPLRILILNLMPTKIVTETQLARLLANSPLQVQLTFLQTKTHDTTHTPQEHMKAFYKTFDAVRNERFDGMIITGAPIEDLDYEDVDYWNEICEIMEWTKHHVFSTMHICWAALAGLYYHFDVPKYDLPQKMFGVFPQKVLAPHCQLLRGFNDVFHAPHSRHAEVHREDIEKVPRLRILTESELSGVHIVANKNGRQYFITGHSEYDRDTLKEEYFRDREKGAEIAVPYGYFPDDDPAKEPHFSWGCSANLLFSNWINHCVYQLTPYDLTALELYNWEWEAGL